jgi:hypothetical protein
MRRANDTDLSEVRASTTSRPAHVVKVVHLYALSRFGRHLTVMLRLTTARDGW